MPDKSKNIIEGILNGILDKALALRYDICTCPACRNDMIAYTLSQLTPQYINTDQETTFTPKELSNLGQDQEIYRTLLSAIEIIGKNPRHKLTEDKKLLFGLLLKKIYEERGIDFRNYHKDILKRRFALRIHANNLNSYSEYLHFLLRQPEEYDRLFETLCINVSEFFRDPEIWVTLKYLLENLIRTKFQQNNKSIKIWSAGCANGEEPYSLAITLKELLQDKFDDFRIEICGTDIDKKCLNAAEKGKYDKNSNKNIPGDILEKYFITLNLG